MSFPMCLGMGGEGKQSTEEPTGSPEMTRHSQYGTGEEKLHILFDASSICLF